MACVYWELTSFLNTATRDPAVSSIIIIRTRTPVYCEKIIVSYTNNIHAANIQVIQPNPCTAELFVDIFHS